MNIEYKKLRSATNILRDFCYVQFCYSTFRWTNKSQNRKLHGRNSAGAMIKLPRHVYSPNSEASVSNDGKIPGFCKFLFLSSVIKFDNKMIKSIQTSQSPNSSGWPFVYAKSKFTLQDAYDVIYHQVIPSFGNSSYFIIHRRHNFSLILGLILLKLKHASNRPIYFREPFLLTEQY